ncbi:MAG: RNA pseudouridine synthase [Rhodobacterales bacterium CG15_BIG_FIL_POST_REV_8_21_14_020_59_13]|nr:MAG: RNA pseudouridine synthase [Rhodobacterales bacterium CG15_BIG_FIL_POST_REV_8_21_14_020_59_13]
MTPSLPPGPFVYTPPLKGELPVIFADDHILVLDKPSGLLTVPGNHPDRADCLESRSREVFPTARIVHRLDMDTSGVIVLGLTIPAHADLGRQFEKRQTMKRYIARVWGEMPKAAGRVEQPIITDWPNRPRQMIDHARGRPAITDWRVLGIEGGHSRVELVPLTGRSHQLRVHMAHLEHPVLGDNFYAHAAARAASARLCLHAQSLGLRHPVTGEEMAFESAVPF